MPARGPGCPARKSSFARLANRVSSASARTPGPCGCRWNGPRELLTKFRAERGTKLIPDDLDALESHPNMSVQVTDHYLADLAAKHHCKLATLDADLKHPAAELVA